MLIRKYIGPALLGGFVAIAACEPITTNFSTSDYSANATVTYTWHVRYNQDSGQDRPNDTRIEKFASVSLENQNGVRPGLAVTGPDEKGLWWPQLPPKPTVDDIEARLDKNERPEAPELIKSVDYTLTVNQAGQQRTLPTRYEVYREAVKAHANQSPLEVILGPQDGSVLSVNVQ
ncbi:hypothetical protein N836_30655 [Leptolyngbya sp. Heron Island J]|uniref:hypothetical protein n=1 Tax=Leptolyngbya sp. Heron Island J TaxID=1385935 RepID=UPI0003B974FF|nr:hypothetical protein [Leptolyngbya sp. Heron Island J]ESA38891.1 hypothetical protein N836_30655 [Leptolyngbya sp. Heron Island J]